MNDNNNTAAEPSASAPAREVYATREDLADAVHGRITGTVDPRVIVRVLALLPLDWPAYKPDPYRDHNIAALEAIVLPGHTVDAEWLGEIHDALLSWRDLEAVRQREAIDRARYLLRLTTDDDVSAIITQLRGHERDHPGEVMRALAECGVELPEPTERAEDGRPLYPIATIATLLYIDPEASASADTPAAGPTTL